MSLKNLIKSTLASMIIVGISTPVMPANALATDDASQSLESIECLSNPLATFDNPQEPKIEIPELTRRYRGYWLSKEEFEHVKSHIKSGKLRKRNIPSYLGFVSLMRYKPLIDFVAGYYGLNPMQVLEVINQETEFNIRIKGKDGERGIGQKMESTAKVLVDNVSNQDHELYYPFFKDDYSFKKLSTDYKLNIILTAAMILTAHSNLNKSLEMAEMTREDLAEKVDELGQKNTFLYLRKDKSDKFHQYNITYRMRKRIHNFWKENDAELRNLDYLAYNGGKDCVTNLLRKQLISEVLQVNFYGYSRKKEGVEKFLALYKETFDSEDK